MNFDPDVVYVVADFLAKSKRPMSQAEVLDEIPFDRRSVSGVVFAMNSCGFLERSGSDDDYRFAIVKNVTAYHLIKMGEIGLDMMSLCQMVKVSDKQKQAAMALAMQTEKLAEMDEAARRKRVEEIAKNSASVPLPRDSIVDTLERLAVASELSIKEMKGLKGNEAVLQALLDAKEQAKLALKKYQSQLGQGGADHVGF